MNSQRLTTLVGSTVFCLIASACSNMEVIADNDCQAQDNLIPVCDFQNPEDLASIPDSDFVIVSEFGGVEPEAEGTLSLFEISTSKRRNLDVDWGQPAVAGDPDCAAPDRIAPHGIDLVRLNNGAWSLLVVNHALRESIEFFEVITTTTPPSLIWRGCLNAPGAAIHNDIVGTADGQFYVTDSIGLASGWMGFKALILGVLLEQPTGSVNKWSKEEGFVSLPGSEAGLPNGIELSPDNNKLYVSAYLGGYVFEYDLKQQLVTRRFELLHPDNMTWTSGGALLVASHSANLIDVFRCRRLKTGSCPIETTVLRLATESDHSRVVFRHAGKPAGAGTVALELEHQWLIGTFAGNRLLRVVKPANH